LDDGAIEHFESMKALKWLDLGNAEMTEEGLDALRKAKPELKVLGVR
jgi:hypothetical protein